MKAKKTIKINPFDYQSIEQAIKDIEEYKRWLREGLVKFIDEMANEGQFVADVKFGEAYYAGDNDVQIEVDSRGELTKAVIAKGNAVLFIEFGTGYVYPRTHPEEMFSEGSWSKSHNNKIDKLGRWRYKGDPGNMGSVNSKGTVTTTGNPSNNSLYLTKVELTQRVQKIAERCWK